MIRRAGGDAVEMALKPPEWRIDREAIEAAISARTRAIIFNNPHNPTGRLFDASELEVIAEVAGEHDLIVISDEVWEHILLDGQRFTPLAKLAGHGRAHDQGWLRRQDLLADRMEGRLDRRRAGNGDALPRGLTSS